MRSSTHPHSRRRFLRTTLGSSLMLPSTLWLSASLAGCAGPAGSSAASSPSGGQQGGPQARALHALFAEHWDFNTRMSPEWATLRGDHRYGDQLSEVSPQAEEQRRSAQQGFLARAQAIERSALPEQDRISRDLFIYNLQTQLNLARFEGYRSMNLGALRGPHTLMANLLQAQPVDTPQQREQLLARMAAHPRRIRQEIEQLRRGKALGWVSAQSVLERVLQQLDGQIKADVRSGPFMEPLRRLPKTLDATAAKAFAEKGQAAVQRDVLPALAELRGFIAAELLPASSAAGSLRRYPGGTEVYQALAQQNTTTRKTPEQIHQMGLQELERLHEEFRKVMGTLGLQGSFAQAVQALNSPDQFFTSSAAMMDGYRSVAKQLDPWMPRLFVELPRTPYGIRAMADHLGPGAADNYSGPAADGSTPGWYNANVLAYQRRPRWALPTLVAHETVPGHHLQIARSRELGELPDFRRQGGYTAFSEGWGLYAERLMDEVGFYEKPQERFGHLQGQAFRAARLVVDTGIHEYGWSRQKAIDFMIEWVGESPVFMTAEVDRYISTPGQALAYMVGNLHIMEQRGNCQRTLGARFDARRFNNAVIDQGALPLDVLTQQLQEWSRRQAAS